MLSNANYILRTYLQYSDNIHCIDRATLFIGVKGRMQREQEKRRFLEIPRPTADS